MIDYMETGFLGSSNFPVSMGMSNGYIMGSAPAGSIASSAGINHCGMENFNNHQRPRTSTSTTEFILKEIGTTSSDSVFNNTHNMTNIHGRSNNFPPSAATPASMAMTNLTYIQQPNGSVIQNGTPPMYDFNRKISNEITNRAVPASSTNPVLLGNNYLQASSESKILSSESGSCYGSIESMGNFGSSGEDPFAFTNGNLNDGFDSNPPSISSSILSDSFDLKEEAPQTVPQCPSTSDVTPIDMEHQEVIKTERKRLRNRVAASKCRKRKLERIARLEDKVNSLKNQNLELTNSANSLRQQVADLKSKVITHVNSGCQLMLGHQQQLNFHFESPAVM